MNIDALRQMSESIKLLGARANEELPRVRTKHFIKWNKKKKKFNKTSRTIMGKKKKTFRYPTKQEVTEYKLKKMFGVKK